MQKISQSVEFGNSVTGSIDIPGSVNTYSFPGGTGDEVVIRITKSTGNLWPRITLFGPSGKQLKQSSGSITTELSSPLPLSGTHTILVDDGFQGTYTGDYTLFAQTTSGTQSATITNVIPVSTGVTTVATPAAKTSPGTPDTTKENTSGGDSLLNYLLIIIIVIVIIGAAGIAYSKFVRKPKSTVTAGHGIHRDPHHIKVVYPGKRGL